MNEIGIQNQSFAVELSFTGIFRKKAAKTLAEHFGTQPEYLKGAYDMWTVQDREGKTWKLVLDRRVHGEWRVPGDFYVNKRSPIVRIRLLSPRLNYAELPKLQNCLRQLEQAGAKVNASCDMSVHVDASNHNRQSLKNLIGIMYSKEDLIYRALQINEERAALYSKRVREPLVEQTRRLSCDETKNLTELEEIWFEGRGRPADAINWTHNYALNLNSVFFHNTVEWNCFNATFQGQQIAACLHLCLAMSAQAIAQRSTVIKRTVSDNEQFTFRTWLVRLGLNGPEYSETRERLLANLEGNKAWKNTRTEIKSKAEANARAETGYRQGTGRKKRREATR